MQGQKCFVGFFLLKKKYAENMKKIIGAVRELPAKYHPPILGGNGRDWLWYLDWQISPKSSHDLFHVFSVIPEKTFARFPARKVMQYSICVFAHNLNWCVIFFTHFLIIYSDVERALSRLTAKTCRKPHLLFNTDSNDFRFRSFNIQILSNCCMY